MNNKINIGDTKIINEEYKINVTGKCPRVFPSGTTLKIVNLETWVDSETFVVVEGQEDNGEVSRFTIDWDNVY